MSQDTISTPVPTDNTKYVSSVEHLPFFIVHRLKMDPKPGLKLMGDYVLHPTFRAAKFEAKRLAAKFPGQKFVVLEACQSLCVDPSTGIEQ